MNVDVQRIVDAPPSDEDIQQWVTTTLQVQGHSPDAEMTVRIVGTDEISALNETYRHKSGPTNVLSFPVDMPPEVELDLLGDVIIAADVVAAEAAAQGKPEMAHWAHMVVHGSLHLLGYDHLDETEAQTMENLEIRILEQLGYPNPYQQKATT